MICCAGAARAQQPLSFGAWGASPYAPLIGYQLSGNTQPLGKKWQLSTYQGISAGYGFGGPYGVSMISAPMGVQLQRQLKRNLYAFTGVSVAPGFVNFGSAFLHPGAYAAYPGNSFFNAGNLGLSSRVDLGLMYVNDQRTFSISGSIHVDRGDYYPMYPMVRPATGAYHPRGSAF